MLPVTVDKRNIVSFESKFSSRKSIFWLKIWPLPQMDQKLELNVNYTNIRIVISSEYSNIFGNFVSAQL